jgi:hypothetical protein
MLFRNAWHAQPKTVIRRFIQSDAIDVKLFLSKSHEVNCHGLYVTDTAFQLFLSVCFVLCPLLLGKYGVALLAAVHHTCI